MVYSEYWNPKNETMVRDQLHALQLLKLRRLCDWSCLGQSLRASRSLKTIGNPGPRRRPPGTEPGTAAGTENDRSLKGLLKGVLWH